MLRARARPQSAGAVFTESTGASYSREAGVGVFPWRVREGVASWRLLYERNAERSGRGGAGCF